MSSPSSVNVVDVCVIGGGINGAGVARDAAGRGYSVLLVEMGDVASATSSWSTKLIHGGLRYLEHYEFALVRSSLIERARLLKLASHLVHPMRFVLPHGPGMRPVWLIRLGLFLYDHLTLDRGVPGSKGINLGSDIAGKVLKPELRKKALTYYDCRTDDVRLVLANLKDAEARGATIRPRTRLIAAEVEGTVWKLTLEHQSGTRATIHARHVVNAAGPWADKAAHTLTGTNSPIGLRLVRGSHLVIRRPDTLNDAYLMQQPDGRVVFLVPWQDDFAMVGTTDTDHVDPAKVAISPEETAYLLEAANRYLAEPIAESDVIWTFAGVRPLLDDGADDAQKVTRDYRIISEKHQRAGVSHIFGGKLTTFRTLSKKVVDEMAEITSPSKPGLDADWTDHTAFDDAFLDAARPKLLMEELTEALAPALGVAAAAKQANRLVETYGRSSQSLGLGLAKKGETPLACGLFPSEIEHFWREEWARTAEDVLYRRTKKGLGLSPEGWTEVEQLLQRLEAQDAA